MDEKVSVIVPVYKVEKYIHRCIDSILGQTYTNLEVILVNDGSPDNCGLIVDQYKELDNRVQVIHKENGGLSDARNRGVSDATGTYIMFVDSDDWLEEVMIETMIHHSLKAKADIVQSAFYYAYDDRLLTDHRMSSIDIEPLALDNQTLMAELVKNKKVKNFAWGKLYKAKFVKNIPFIKGVLFEDVFWAHHVMHNVEKYLILHEPFYYYQQRDDSIVATYTAKNLDIIKGLKKRHVFIEKFYKELVGESYQRILETSIIHYNLLTLNKEQDQQGVLRREIEEYIQTNYSVLKDAVRSNRSLKRQLYLFTLHPYINIGMLGFLKGLRKFKLVSTPKELRQVNK